MTLAHSPLAVMLALPAAVAAPPQAPPATLPGSVWDYLVKGGPTIAVIALCSLVALAVVVERALVLRRRLVAPPGFADSLRPLASDPAGALRACESANHPLARILAAALRRWPGGRSAAERAAQNAARREMVSLRRRMRLLGALPQAATMLGLLGTIFGMIKVFQAVASSSQALGKTELLAQGIFEAWTNTAAGLIVAIPTLILYHVLLARLDSLAADLDAAVTAVLDHLAPAAGADHAPRVLSAPRHHPANHLDAPLPEPAAV